MFFLNGVSSPMFEGVGHYNTCTTSVVALHVKGFCPSMSATSGLPFEISFVELPCL